MDNDEGEFNISFEETIVIIVNATINKTLTISKNSFEANEMDTDITTGKLIYGVLGIISFQENYYIGYIRDAIKICTIKLNSSDAQIYQIKEVNFECIQSNSQKESSDINIQNLKSLLENGMFYFSTKYDLSTTIPCQRGYLDHKAFKKDYLWNVNMLEPFKYQSIDIGEFFVFCMCGYVGYCTEKLTNDKDVNCYCFSRKKHNNLKANHTQLEVLLETEIGIFSFVSYSFGYENELDKDKDSIIKTYTDNYSIYNGKGKEVLTSQQLLNKQKTEMEIESNQSNKSEKELKKEKEKREKKEKKEREKKEKKERKEKKEKEKKAREKNMKEGKMEDIKLEDDDVTNSIIFIDQKTKDNQNKSNLKIKTTEIKNILFDLFKEQHHYCFKGSDNISDINLFIKGMKLIVDSLSYTLMLRKETSDLLDFDFEAFLQSKRSMLQKKHSVIISVDGIDLTILFQKVMIKDIISRFLNNNVAQMIATSQMEEEQNKNQSSNSISETSSKSNSKNKPNANEKLLSQQFFLKYDTLFDQYRNHALKLNKNKDYDIMETLFIHQLINEPAFALANFSQKNSEKLSICIVTWNVNAIDLSKESNLNMYKSLYNFNYPDEKTKFTPDIFMFGFQEIVELKADNVIINNSISIKNSEQWKKLLEDGLPNYKCLGYECLVGVVLLIFVKNTISKKIHISSQEFIKTGFGGKLGNKGSCIIHFNYEGKSFSAATCHLAAGDSHNKNRIEELNSLSEHKDKNNSKFIDSDFWFIFGDCNFRFELEQKITQQYLEKCTFEQLRAKDQLKMNKYKLDFGYNEEEITFKPTYKLHNGQTVYNTKRNYAWCDRILFKKNKMIKPLRYMSIPLYISDHKPVYGLFEILI